MNSRDARWRARTGLDAAWRLLCHLLLYPVVVVMALPVEGAGYDLVLRNGWVVDGSGGAPVRGDVGIHKGRITGVGVIPPRVADFEQDISGMVVAPGFVDVHTHAEGILGMPLAENFVRMGVTTLVLGNCGSSTENVGRFFRQVDSQAIAVNVATLIGHGTIREGVMGGSFNRPPTEEEKLGMREAVERAMREGAVGMSTGLIYLPGTFAATEELIDLLRVVSAHGGIHATHMRNESDRIMEALEETFRMARESGVRTEISHLKLAGKANWGQTGKVLGAIEAARAAGLGVTHDQYAYTASSTSISQLIPDSAREGGKFKERVGDPELKAAMKEQMRRELGESGREDYGYAVIAYCGFDPGLNGLSILEASRKMRGGESLEDQLETILAIEVQGGASGVFHGMDEGDLQRFMMDPYTMVAADSGLRKFNEGVPHPRGYGNNARILARYVRELKILPLEEAVRRMTSLPATTFHLRDRGLIQPGYWADLVVFDPEKAQDNATFEEPHQYSTGFRYVFVNGRVVVENDRHTGEKPGKALRHRPEPGGVGSGGG